MNGVVQSILMPVIKKELSEIVFWLKNCPASGVKNGEFYISMDMAWSSTDKQLIEKAFSCGALSKEGFTLFFIDCNMEKTESFYIRDSSHKLDLDAFPYGLKSGPNLQFFKSLRSVKSLTKSKAVLLCEVDAFPLRSKWLRDLSLAVEGSKSNPLIAGAKYTGRTKLSNSIKDHYNGNSIYFIGDKDFEGFLNDWEKKLLLSIPAYPNLAYDFAIPFLDYYNKIDGDLGKIYFDRSLNLTGLLVNHGSDLEASPDYVFSVRKLVAKHPDILIFHSKCAVLKLGRLKFSCIDIVSYLIRKTLILR